MTICPTITAYDPDEYKRQINTVAAFAERIHIDLMDGEFAPTKSPELSTIWWPTELKADIHLMYQNPMDYLEQLIKLKPRLVIIHYEANVHHMHFAAELHKAGILAGLAVLKTTPIEDTFEIIHSFDHVLIFSGNLGFHGGNADLSILNNVALVREQHPDAEIGWDGGINADNAKQLVGAGIDVLNVGSFIQEADNPAAAYAKLKEVIQD